MQVEVRWLKDSLTNILQKDTKRMSAGTKPVSQINPIAIEVMKEVGIDISNQKSKEITEDMMRNSSKL